MPPGPGSLHLAGAPFKRAVLPWSQLGHWWWRGGRPSLVQEQEAGVFTLPSLLPRTRDSVQKTQREQKWAEVITSLALLTAYLSLL